MHRSSDLGRVFRALDGRVKGCGHSTSCERPWDLLKLVIACEPCTQTESTFLWQDEVSQGLHIYFILRCSQLLGAQLCNNAAESSVHNESMIICDTDRTEMSVKEKAQNKQTLKPL